MSDITMQELQDENSELTEKLLSSEFLRNQMSKIRDGSYGELSFHMQMRYLLENESFPDYHFFSNIRFIRVSDDHQDTYESQVDHLLVSPHGIFLFNTKRWKGDTWLFKYDDMDIFMKTLFGRKFSKHGGYSLLNMRSYGFPNSPHDVSECNITDYSNPMYHICSQAGAFRNYLSMLMPDVQQIHPVLAFDVGNNIGHLIKISIKQGKLVKSPDPCFFDVLRLKPQGTLLFFLTFLEGDDILLPDRHSLSVLRKFLRTGIAAPDYDTVYTSDQVDKIVNLIHERRMLAHSSLYIAGHI